MRTHVQRNESAEAAVLADVQALIRQYNGSWLIENHIRLEAAALQREMSALLADPRRTVVFPSEADMKTADDVFGKVVDGFAAKSAHNAELVEAAVAALREKVSR